MDVDAPGAPAPGAVRPVGRVHVGNAVGVDVADDREKHRAERVAGFVRIDHERRVTRQRGVDVDAAVLGRARGQRAPTTRSFRLLMVAPATALPN